MAKGIITTKSGSGAPFRVAPDATAEMIGALESGSTIELISYGDGWYFADVDGQQGYVAGSMVQALDGIEGLGKISIKKSKNKNGSKSIAVKQVKPAMVKSAKTSNPAKKGGIMKAISASAKPMAKIASAKQAIAAKPMTKDAAKKNLESLIKRAKAAGITEDEIKQMASLNGLGNLTDLNGLKDLVQKATTAVKNVGSKIVNAGKKVTSAGEQVTNAANAVQQPAAAQQTTVVVPDTTNLNNNNQNQSTMDDVKKEKLKKALIITGAVAGVTTIGVIAYKMSKKKKAAAKGALNGVSKKRRKSRKSKKNTGNKMLNLK